MSTTVPPFVYAGEYRGEKGVKGDTGSTGSTGATGATGPTGAPGPGGWAPTTSYTASDVVQAPDGSRISRNTTGTSRSTFDTTEQAAWTTVLSKAGTLEQVAVASSTGQMTTVSKTANYTTTTAQEFIEADATSAVITITGPAAGAVKRWGVKKVNGTSASPGNKVTISYLNSTGAVATLDLTLAAESKVFRPSGSGYRVESGDTPKAGLDTSYPSLLGANVARFVTRARAGENLAICAVGDSVLEGLTVTDTANDDLMHLLKTDLAARFGVTITMTNRAQSGFTTAMSHIYGNFGTALTDNADLYVIAFGKNDVIADKFASPVPGYPRAASVAALERMVRLIRANVPKADIIVMAENPESAGSGTNPYLVTYNAAAKRVAAVYGCEWIDCYQPFIDRVGGYASLMADASHPNTAGHRFIADIVEAHLPNVANLVPIQSAQPATKGLSTVERVNTAAGTKYGYCQINAPGTTTFANGASVTWTNSGTWTGASAPFVTTTTSSYAEWAFTGTELLVFIDCTVGKAPVVDITVDGAAVVTDWALAQGNPAQKYVPLATGLAEGAHTVRVTRKSGSLEVYAAVALAGVVSTFSPTVVAPVAVTATVGNLAVPTDGTTVSLVGTGGSTPIIALPSGWTKQSILVTGSVSLGIDAITTTQRNINVLLTLGGTNRLNLNVVIPPVAAADGIELVVPVNFQYEASSSQAVVWTVSTTASTDKDHVRVKRHYLQYSQSRTL